MVVQSGTIIARAATDAQGFLVEAQEPLAGLQRRCGGETPGEIAIPELRQLVAKAQAYGLRLARTMTAHDGQALITAWVEIVPLPAGDEDGSSGCEILVSSWQSDPLSEELGREGHRRDLEIARATAEFTAILGPDQAMLAVDAIAPDLRRVAATMQETIGSNWVQHVDLPEFDQQTPIHWRLLDGAQCRLRDVARSFTIRLFPLGKPDQPTGFELFMLPNAPRPQDNRSQQSSTDRFGLADVARDLIPAMKGPADTIALNARKASLRLAGPLGEEYAAYAADIAEAASHLHALLEDLQDLGAIEREDFDLRKENLDLAGAGRRAVAMMARNATDRQIALEAPADDQTAPAYGDFRRVLQIVLNLLGNAIRYGPAGEPVTVAATQEDGAVSLSVLDRGGGLGDAEQVAVFEKFERLGRSGDGGSGLGLYISHKLARAMGGDLTVESRPGQGTRFTLTLPAAD